MKTSRSVHHGILALVPLLLIWLYSGILTDRSEHETSTLFFLKTSPTLQLYFESPYESEILGYDESYKNRMDKNGYWLPGTQEFIAFEAYCKYRFGVANIQSRYQADNCKAQDHLASHPFKR